MNTRFSKMNLTNVIIFIILAVNISKVKTEKKKYEGYTVYKVIPKVENEVDILNELHSKGVVELWNDYLMVNNKIMVMVAPEKREIFLEAAEKASIEANRVIEDVQKLIDEQFQEKPRKSRNTSAFLSHNWENYHTLEDIYKWLDELEATYPDIVSTVVMGRSFEGREIKGVKINFRPEVNTLIGMIEGGLHAREWISPATVTWIIKEFLISTDPDVRALAEEFEWHIFPVVNPDGYTYTFDPDNRLWRKNRNTNHSKTCELADDDMSNGIDLNRNFDFFWMSAGASNDSCSNLFAGPSAFSEPETRAIADYVLDIKDKGEFIYYIAFHSYTQLIIAPYSHVETVEDMQADNYGDLYEIGVRGADKIKRHYGTQYRTGISADVMYPMSGGSFDWVKYVAGVPITYLIELRDLGEYGFLLPADQIIPNNLEIMDGLLEMDRTTATLGYYVKTINNANLAFVSMVLLIFGTVLTIVF